ncbi:MAG TPA: hypothetical protein ENJ95_03895 [Bacteroidetes bacterium]|nr:hypothetical protein [Bacteroidota bacterium]
MTLIIKTLYTNISEKTCLLISGAKSKVNKEGKIIDKKTEKDILKLIGDFYEIIENI